MRERIRLMWWTLVTLMAHWRRHPFNLATLFTGLAVATALWSGVQALNHQARASYDRAAALFGEAGAASLVSAEGAFLPQAHFVALRRAGVKVSPVLEGSVRLAGRSYRLIGIEPLTARRDTALAGLRTSEDLLRFLKAPGETLVAPETLAELGAAAGDMLRSERSEELPPLSLSDAVAPGVLVVDIGAAQRILGRPDQVSRLMVAEGQLPDSEALRLVVGDALRIESADEGGDLSRLTASFHLNLTAFGLLAFIVGLFIVHASIGLAFEQRLSTVRTLRAVGVPLTTLIAALVSELLLLALAAGVLGMVGGYVVASALLPDMAASLKGLYGAEVGRSLTLEARWWISGLAMALAGTLIAAALGLLRVYRLPILAAAQPVAWRGALDLQLRRQGVLAVVSLAIGFVAYVAGSGLVAGFVVIAGLLLGAALLLPLVLSRVLALGERRAEAALARWFWADARQQLSGLTLALMALLLALAANVGVGTMVDGFRKTFTGWLDERLNSELYFEAASAADGARIGEWFAAQPGVNAVLPVWRAETRLDGWPVDVYGTRDHATYRDHFSLLRSVPDAWDRVRDGSGVLVSEQIAQRLGLALGDDVAIPAADRSWRAPVVGIFPDYGNPKGQVRIDVSQLVAHWPDARKTNFSVRAEANHVADLVAALQATHGAALVRVSDQAALKQMSMGIFERTFAVTAALNTLTLAVSGVALFSSLLALSGGRLAQIAPVWALGVTRQRLSTLEVGKILMLAAVTALLAIPLGLMLAWCLVAIVNVQVFGWRLPFHVFPAQWAVVFGLAVLTAFVAAIVPVMRLARTAPADLLKVFANER